MHEESIPWHSIHVQEDDIFSNINLTYISVPPPKKKKKKMEVHTQSTVPSPPRVTTKSTFSCRSEMPSSVKKQNENE